MTWGNANNILDNVIQNNTDVGIRVDVSSYNVIDSNDIISLRDGIKILDHSCVSNIISNNNIGYDSSNYLCIDDLGLNTVQTGNTCYETNSEVNDIPGYQGAFFILFSACGILCVVARGMLRKKHE